MNEQAIENGIDMAIKKAIAASKATGTAARKVPAKKQSPAIAFATWQAKQIESVQNALEGIYPSNWDFQVVKQLTGPQQTEIETAYAAAQGDIKKLPSSIMEKYHGHIYFKAIILFPIINLINSRGDKHTIKDLYVIINFTPFMKMAQKFEGYRGRRSLLEHVNNYSHSHLHSNTDNIQTFCLGDTAFDTLVVSLQSTWDFDAFFMFIIQLKDYVHWESLEGGPYMRVRELKNKDFNSVPPSPSNGELDAYYKRFLSTFDQVDTEILDATGIPRFVVKPNKPLWDMVTQITNEKHLLLYDPIKGKTFIERNDSPEVINKAVRQHNAALATGSVRLNFKGSPVRLTIEEVQEEKKENRTYIANEVILKYIADRLSRSLNKFFIDDFINS